MENKKQELKETEEKLYNVYMGLIKVPIIVLITEIVITGLLSNAFGILMGALLALIPSIIIGKTMSYVLIKTMDFLAKKVVDLRKETKEEDNKSKNVKKHKKVYGIEQSKKLSNKEKIHLLNQAKLNLTYDNNKYKKNYKKQFQKTMYK